METDKKRKTYDRQFRLDAVNLVVNGGRSLSEVARVWESMRTRCIAGNGV